MQTSYSYDNAERNIDESLTDLTKLMVDIKEANLNQEEILETIQDIHDNINTHIGTMGQEMNSSVSEVERLESEYGELKAEFDCERSELESQIIGGLTASDLGTELRVNELTILMTKLVNSHDYYTKLEALKELVNGKPSNPLIF